jgi:uracil-DNA glycosylase
MSLEDLGARLGTFDGCGLKATAKSLCFYRGAPAARVMIIGEAPGAEDDKAGKPFAGAAGQMLDKMLAAIGLDESTVHMTNVVYWRPPGNRTPTPQEVAVCRPFLERQVELVAPQFVILFGGPAANIVLGESEGIMKLRGGWRDFTIGSHPTRVIVTFHPNHLIRTPPAKKMAWRDLLAIDAALKGIGKG